MMCSTLHVYLVQGSLKQRSVYTHVKMPTMFVCTHLFHLNMLVHQAIARFAVVLIGLCF
eukprot:m.295538 g.295538  ORF g.295538 m.295538 type:complete len:59 (-) comp15855_c0_seq4:1608-1784(-)